MFNVWLGIRFREDVIRELGSREAFTIPRLTVIMPIKGPESRLEQNLLTLLHPNSSQPKLLFVVDSTYDPAYSAVSKFVSRFSKGDAQIVTAVRKETCSGKNSAILTALNHLPMDSDVLAFVDSDCMLPEDWSVKIVSPLSEPSVGASTCFRWYFPISGSFWSHVLSAWNAAGANLLFDDSYSFVWGGGYVIQRNVLDEVGARNAWAISLSDDLVLTQLLRQAGYKIRFRPQCTVATFEDVDLSALLRWTTRQVVLTRIYHRKIWRYAVFSYGFFNLATLIGLGLIIQAVGLSGQFLLQGILALSHMPLGLIRGKLRYDSFARALPEFRSEFRRRQLGHLLGSFVVPWVMAYCLIRSVLMSDIEWRGRRYIIRDYASSFRAARDLQYAGPE